MGRIKTALMKSSAIVLVKEHGSKMSANFEENKVSIGAQVVTSSKKLKNSIIGYATRIIKLKKLE